MRIYRLPLRAGIGVAIAAAILLAVIGRAFSPMPVWAVAMGALLLGIAGYAIARRLLVDRLHELERLLRAIENRSFDQVDQADLGKGDELADLGQLAKRSSYSVQAEMEALKQVEDYRRDFIGNVSHELKTPIFAIQGFSETLLNGALEDEEVNREFVRKIMRNADRLWNLARDLSEISRIETGELRMDIAPFPPCKMIREVVELLETAAEQKNITLQHVMAEDLPHALADEEKIRQVLINLVDNAIKYSNDGGFVEVVARFVEPDSIKISVADSGIGIDPEHIPRLTERFYRVDKSRSRSQGGTGLGLSIVKHILGAHGRRLRVVSTPGRGSTFGFTLDAAPVTEPAGEGEGAAA